MAILVVEAAAGLLWNLENYWTIDRQTQTFQWDAENYLVKFLEITKSLGAPTDVIPEAADFSKYKFLIVPAYELADSALVNNWADLLDTDKNTEVLATYDNQFYKGNATVVRRKLGKSSVTYIVVSTDDLKLEKDILREIYKNAMTTAIYAYIVHGDRIFDGFQVCKNCNWSIKKFTYSLLNFFCFIVTILNCPMSGQ